MHRRHALASLAACLLASVGLLVGSGRWGPERAEQLLRDIECCGPMAPVS